MFTDNSVAIVALVDEEKEESLDNVLSKFDAVILRRDIAFVTEEVAEAKRLELEVQNQVREQWKADKKKELTDKAQEYQSSILAKIDQDYSKFGHTRKMAAIVSEKLGVPAGIIK